MVDYGLQLYVLVKILHARKLKTKSRNFIKLVDFYNYIDSTQILDPVWAIRTATLCKFCFHIFFFEMSKKNLTHIPGASTWRHWADFDCLEISKKINTKLKKKINDCYTLQNLSNSPSSKSFLKFDLLHKASVSV